MSTPPRTPTRRLRRTDSGRSGSASSGRSSRSRRRTPSPHGSRSARSGSASSGRSSRSRGRSASRSASPTASIASKSTAADVERPPWWDPWEARLCPEERQVVGLREFWGSTGGRLGRWVADEGWRPPPPKLNLDEHDDESVSSLEKLCGKDMEFKPRRGVTWVDGTVCKLELVRHGLEGPLPGPRGLAVLRTCVVLNLRGNALSGNIPGDIGNMVALEHLDLAENDLEGAIPADLVYCKLLRVLRLEDNGLFGPVNIGPMEHLVELCAQRNRLSGRLPDELGECSKLELVLLHDNANLRGAVPPSLVNCVDLKRLLLCGTRVDPRNLKRGELAEKLAERGCDVQVSPPQVSEDSLVQASRDRSGSG